MSEGMVIALSGALAQQQRLDDVSHNLANADTPGFRQRRVAFQSILVDEVSGIHYAARATEGIDMSTGPLTQTNDPLDVSITGRGFFRVGDPKGPVQLTRNGQFRLSPQGQLQTRSGLPVLDASGQPIVVQATPEELLIGEGGDIWDAFGIVGSLGVVDLQNVADLKASGQGLYTTGAQNLLPSQGKVVQGSVERGNVNPVSAMAEMITLHRHYEAMHNLIQTHKRLDEKTVSTVGMVR